MSPVDRPAPEVVEGMKRWLFNVAAAVSLLLCLATAGLWVRSYSREDDFTWVGEHDRIVRLTSSGGCMMVVTGKATSIPPCCNFQSRPVGIPISVSFGGRFRAGRVYMAGPGAGKLLTNSAEYVLFPHWVVVAVFSILPFLWGPYRRGPVRERGRCVACGYDLRATPDRCPECGTITRMKDEDEG